MATVEESREEEAIQNHQKNYYPNKVFEQEIIEENQNAQDTFHQDYM